MQSQAVREELRGTDGRRRSRRLLQQAEELLQEWGASLLQLFEVGVLGGSYIDRICTAGSRALQDS